MGFPKFIRAHTRFEGIKRGDISITIHNTGQYGEDSEGITLKDSELDEFIESLLYLRKL